MKSACLYWLSPVALALVACGSEATGPARGAAPALNLNGPQANLEAILRDPAGGGAQGNVKFRQRDDGTQIIDLDTAIRGLAPNTSYYLQRATDPQDGICTGNNWLTLGLGPTPAAIVTDDKGSGTAALWRDLAGRAAPGDQFDIAFRIIDGVGAVALTSGCYQFTSID
jgi:hypothetical protein